MPGTGGATDWAEVFLEAFSGRREGVFDLVFFGRAVLAAGAASLGAGSEADD